MADSPVLFELKDVRFSYVGRAPWLLDGVNLTVKKGERLVIIGPSGCGKSTLIKILVGLLGPQSGHALFDGAELHRLPVRKQKPLMQRIGMTFQNSGLFDSLSCGENLSFPLEENKIPQREWKERVAIALQEVGLSGIENLRTHEISGGMKKRLGIARALMLKPEVVLYDDPTAGLDPVTSSSITALIDSMRKKFQMTAVMVTADLMQAYRLADRLAFFHEGKFTEVGTVDEIRKSSHPAVSQFMNGRLEGPLTVSAKRGREPRDRV